MDGSTPPAETEARVPPCDLDAEAAILSALFIDPSTQVELEPEHFYADANAWIYRAILATAPADIVTVAHWLRAQGRLAQIGGQPYLALITDCTPAVANVAAHAAIVRECWRRRVLIRVFAQVQAELYAGLGADEAWRRVREECAT